jgi:hypothetical protein
MGFTKLESVWSPPSYYSMIAKESTTIEYGAIIVIAK